MVNDFLLEMCDKHDVRYIAANNSYYTTRKEADAHDILLCVKDAANVSQPKRYVGKRGREFRFGLPNDEFYLKSPARDETALCRCARGLSYGAGHRGWLRGL